MNQSIILALVAFTLTWLFYPLVYRFAIKHSLMDKPDAERKLQKVPVPVLGGVAVATSLLPIACVVFTMFDGWHMWSVLVALLILLIIGVIDDLHQLKATFRFIIEIAVVGSMIAFTHSSINHLQGLFGIDHPLSPFSSIPLSIFAGVGIINAINMIDGIDGYSSGFCIVSFSIFATFFYFSGDMLLTTLCMVAAAAVIPFFVHNAIMRNGKMFIGDGGTMLLGTLLTYCVFATMATETPCLVMADKGISLAAFTLAVLCIPVFDTLRVMTMRILSGRSPFSPDKTHLHHLYLELGCNHLQTSLIIIAINCIIVALWYAAWRLGFSPVMQVCWVALLGTLATFVTYPVVKLLINRKNS
ncbi:MAG: undecaprenyl/decaprenyl-phosphate alpha-N-acetylglucosaminyl 1-phosphate transferase [Paludibacteraceae bacterium]|nr:undecaprenyl/decaprenyl-phosphate alpha-N-acetylglucosaminyl 1-phosphate transferase [Paludibacteraceae bacterium]